MRETNPFLIFTRRFDEIGVHYMITGSVAATHWAGLDWGDKEHALCVVTDTGHRVEQRRVPHNAEGLAEMIVVLRGAPNLAGIVVETSRQLTVDALVRAGFTLKTAVEFA
jgi:hypothetical protein